MSRATSLAAQEESRLALASAAARAERQNQPKGLLYGAGLLLLVALIFVGLALRTSLEAGDDLATQKGQADQVIKQAGKFKALSDAAKAGPELNNQSLTQLRTRIEQAGLDVGLKAKIPLPQTHDERPPGLGSKQTRYDYEVRDEDLPKLLQWVQKSVADVPGLEVYSISLRPDAHQWIMRVSYSRWERIEGT
jgi:hypothetical protein